MDHIEEEWLEFGSAELEQRKTKRKQDCEVAEGPKEAVVAVEVVEPGWDTPKGIANVGNTCYINTILQCFMAAAPIAISMWAGNCNGERLTQQIKDVMHELEVDGAAQRSTLLELRYGVLTEAVHRGLYGGGRRVPETWLCANEVLQLMSGAAQLTEVVVGEEISCSGCRATHVTHQPPYALVQLPLPAIGGPSVESMVKDWGEDEVVPDYRCTREGCGGRGAAKKSVFVSLPDVVVFGIQQVEPARGIGEEPVVHKRAVTLSEELDLQDLAGWKKYALVGVVHHDPGHWLAMVRGRDGHSWYGCSDMHVSRRSLPEEMVCSFVMYVNKDFLSFKDARVQRIFRRT